MHITIYKEPGGPAIPPKNYGGVERIIYWLGKALVALGHKVTLIHDARSEIPGVESRPVPLDKQSSTAWHKLVPDSTDIVHLWDTENPDSPKPFLVTIEGNGGHEARKFHPNTVFVSGKHAANHGSKHFVWNGVDPDEYLFSEKREDYAVFLAKARWNVKNFSGAVAIARKAGVELRVLGSRNWPLNLQRLLPPIRGVRYYGMMGGREKAEIISRARCLIFPVRWEEPCAVAVPEALVSGCYVAATPYGCLPEIATPDVGLCSAKLDELADAVENPQRFSPQKCRDRILLGGLTHLDMAKKYVACYEKILSKGSLLEPGESAAMTRPGFDPKILLPWNQD
jgi:glycosyltransferase involved in cell wall biosynthesis